MAEREQTKSKQHPEMVSLVIFIAVLAGAWQAFFGGSEPPAQASPQEPPAVAAPLDVSPSGWVRPVDAPLWGGFRTPDNPDHQGVDIGGVRGQQIRAAAAGVVVRVRCNATLGGAEVSCDVDGSPQHRGCGWYVDIRHDNDVFTRYCHMLRRPDVAVDQAVAAGQVLGVVGSSGRSSAPHLHFEVHLGDQSAATATDPVAFMAEHGAPLG